MTSEFFLCQLTIGIGINTGEELRMLTMRDFMPPKLLQRHYSICIQIQLDKWGRSMPFTTRASGIAGSGQCRESDRKAYD